MISRHGFRLPPLCRLALYLTALRVPRRQRPEWTSEWTSELWYVCESVSQDRPFPRRQVAIAQFCLGAVVDAGCVRKLHAGSHPNHRTHSRASGSAVACLASLAIGVGVCFAIAQTVPRVRHALQRPIYHRVTSIVTISPLRLAGSAQPAIRLESVRSWERRPQHLFADFAFYEPVIKPVHIAAHTIPELTIARSSSNLLSLLGVPVLFRPHTQIIDALPRLILTESAWRTHFGGRREIFGDSIRVGLQTVRLDGIVSDETTPAPGHVDAWLLLPDEAADAMPGDARVFAIGRLAARPAGTPGEWWKMSVSTGGGQSSDYDCVALSAQQAGPWRIFAFTVFLALLSLPATTSLPLGDYPARKVKLSWTSGLRRWLFLGAKVALAILAVYLGSMDLAYCLHWSSPDAPQYIQLVSSFCGTLFALRWALRDQRQRCPVCLGKLVCPVRVGQPSRNFLAWNGTELICSGGHGFLHVPELPTSWFSSPRWLHLDASWSGLFLYPA